MKERRTSLVNNLLNVRGELLLLKRTQQKLDEKLELLVRSHAGLAALLHEQRRLLEELHIGDENALRPRKDVSLKKAA